MSEEINKDDKIIKANRRTTVLNTEVTDKLIDILALYTESINLYRTLGLLAKSQGFLGSGDYLYIQRKERSHSATDLHRFLDVAGAVFVIPCGEEVEVDAEATLEELFVKALDNEIKITDALNEVASIAIEDKQFTAFGYIQEELKFQLGEESEARDRIAIVQASEGDLMSADLKIANLIKKRKK